VLLAAVAAIRWTVIGSPTVLSGQVKSAGVMKYKTGTWRYFVVTLPDRAVRADSYSSAPCRVGDRIQVRREPHLLGPKYIALPTSCAAQ
jgi:hypothetical protein